MVNPLLRAATRALPRGVRGWLESSPGQCCNEGPPPDPAAFVLSIKHLVISGKHCIKSWIILLFLGGKLNFGSHDLLV